MKFDAVLHTDHLNDIPDLARRAEQLGIRGLWTTETTHNPFLPLTHVAAHTERLEFGTGIAVAFPRSPMVTAQLAWDLAGQSGGRFILGLGTQVKAHIVRRFSTVWDKPGPRLKEYILALRAIWDCWQNQTPLRFDGDYYKFSLMTPFFAPPPIEQPAIPIYVAGVNAYLCRLAGELCQGFHVHSFHTPRYLREVVLPNVGQGASVAGRSRGDVQMTCGIFVVTGADNQEIENNRLLIKGQIAFYASTPSYQSVLQLHGWESLGEQLNALSRQGRWLEMTALISDDMLEEFAVVAPYDRLAERVRDRYQGLLDRVSYYMPFNSKVPDSVWQDAIHTLSN